MILVTSEMSDDTRLMVEALLGTRELPPMIDADALVGLEIRADIDENGRMTRVSSLDGAISAEWPDATDSGAS